MEILMPINKEQYAKNWKKESILMEENQIYEKLSQITPKCKVLEIGSGVGLSTYHLLKSRDVLALENNNYCIELMKEIFEQRSKDLPCLISDDVLQLQQNSILEIQKFSPQIILAWFIGTCFEDMFKYTQNEPNIDLKPKKYRENIEDVLFNENICLPSVEWIHLANRVHVANSCSDDDIIKSIHDDYSQYVFGINGFEIESITILEWSQANSEFGYISAPNPNFIGGETTPKIISILAKRKLSDLNV